MIRGVRLLAVLASAAGWAAGLSVATAQSVLPDLGFAPGSGIEMRVTSFYEDLPPAGFVPIRVEITNRTNSPRTWQISTLHSESGQQSVTFRTSVHAEAGSERTYDLLVPLLRSSRGGARYSGLVVNVSGHAVTDGSINLHSSTSGGKQTPFIGMGKELSVKNWGPLSDRLQKSHSFALNGTSLDALMLPSDWRAYAGFDLLVFTASEWRRLPGPQRNAILDWLAQGGTLHLYTDGPAGDLPAAGELGCGRIVHHDDPAQLVARFSEILQAPVASPADDTVQGYTWDWAPARMVGRPEAPQAFIMIFVVGFAALIGPVNFLAFAPAGNRHRLFWTTPLIALVATILMGAFIVLSEGFGGSGRCFEGVLSLPDQRKSVAWQEQVSRTGVLVSNAFTPSEPAVMLPISLQEFASSRSHADRGSTYALNGATWGGDWFRNRSAQAQLLTTVLPDRGRLEVTPQPDGPPVAVSSFAHPLTELWYLGENGSVWQGKNLLPGEKQTLTRAQPPAFAAWRKIAVQDAGKVVRTRAEKFFETAAAGKFIASTTPQRPIATLPAIRWQEAGALVFGLAATP